MNDVFRIDCASPVDRDAIVVILAKNGYTVRQGREKRGKSSAYTWFVEYWRNGECSR